MESYWSFTWHVLVLIIYDTSYCDNEYYLVCFGRLMKFYCQILTPLFLIIYRLSCTWPHWLKKEYHISEHGIEEQTLALRKKAKNWTCMWHRTVWINERFCTDVLWKQEMYLFWFQEVSCRKRLSKRTPAEDTKAFRKGTMNFDCLWIYLSKPLLLPFRRRWNSNKYRTKQLNLYSEHYNTWKSKWKRKQACRARPIDCCYFYSSLKMNGEWRTKICKIFTLLRLTYNKKHIQ